MARPRSAGTLADKLAAGRRRHFVGRAAEIELFRRAVASGAGSFTVLFVHGPGGIGKTSLLDIYREVAAAERVPTAHLDARDVPPTPDAVAPAVERLPPRAGGAAGRQLRASGAARRLDPHPAATIRNQTGPAPGKNRTNPTGGGNRLRGG